jgi:hypothetical protein
MLPKLFLLQIMVQYRVRTVAQRLQRLTLLYLPQEVVLLHFQLALGLLPQT